MMGLTPNLYKYDNDKELNQQRQVIYFRKHESHHPHGTFAARLPHTISNSEVEAKDETLGGFVYCTANPSPYLCNSFFLMIQWVDFSRISKGHLKFLRIIANATTTHAFQVLRDELSLIDTEKQWHLPSLVS